MKVVEENQVIPVYSGKNEVIHLHTPIDTIPFFRWKKPDGTMQDVAISNGDAYRTIQAGIFRFFFDRPDIDQQIQKSIEKWVIEE